MKKYILIFISLLTLFTFSSCKKEDSTQVSSNPNVINGCEISQTQIIQTNLFTHQVSSYIILYQYDSIGRLAYIGNGQSSDTDHFNYHDHDGDGDHHNTWHNSSDGYALTSTSLYGSYQYTYDGGGHLQMVMYTDGYGPGGNDSYTESFYWDNNGNLAYSIKQYQSQTVPMTTSYSYYTDKSNQVLNPTNIQLGKRSVNLLKQITTSSGSSFTSTQSYTYVFDTQGKVSQYTVVSEHTQNVYTLTYACH